MGLSVYVCVSLLGGCLQLLWAKPQNNWTGLP